MKVEPHPLLTVGQRVRIKSGALAGVEGIVIRKKSGFRVVLTLSLLMQSIAIEVNGDDVELVDAPSSSTETTYQEKYKQNANNTAVEKFFTDLNALIPSPKLL